jgi:cytochrome b561
MTGNPEKYGRTTRLVHAGVAIAIVLQLASSQFMQVPRNGRTANWAFEVHEFSGMTALALALCLWVVVMTRIAGTDIGALVPWFSAARRDAFWTDLKAHSAAVRRLRLPEYREQSPFASAIHGLGLLLITAMAATGTLYIIAGFFGYQDSAVMRLAMEAHGAGGSLVWAYLIGHAGLATVHHFKRDMSLRDMWSFGPKKSEERIPE